MKKDKPICSECGRKIKFTDVYVYVPSKKFTLKKMYKFTYEFPSKEGGALVEDITLPSPPLCYRCHDTLTFLDKVS